MRFKANARRTWTEEENGQGKKIILLLNSQKQIRRNHHVSYTMTLTNES